VREHSGVELVDLLGDGVRRKRASCGVFRMGQRPAVAVGGAGARVDDALHAGVARRDQHVHEPCRVGGVRAPRVGDRLLDRTERGLVQHHVDRVASPGAGRRVDDVALVEGVPAPRLRADGVAHLIEVAAAAGREVVDPDYDLPQPQERLHEVRSDEAGASRHEPAPGVIPQGGEALGQVHRCGVCHVGNA